MWKSKGLLSLLHNELIQFIILTRHFFFRLFQNDVVDFEDQMKERIIAIIAFLAVFSGLLSFAFLDKYGWIADDGRSWIEKCALMVFFMLIMGFVAVLEWDIIIPDSRDYSNIDPLPVRAKTILGAKFTSLTMFVGLFALGLNSISVFFFILFLPQWQPNSFIFAVNLFFAHLLSMFLACFFAFFLNVVLIGILMALCGHNLFNRISTFVRALLLVAYVLLLFIYFRGIAVGFSYIPVLEKLRTNVFIEQNLYNFFPPFWFTDLYETLIGNTNLPFHGSYQFALIGLVVMGGVFYLTTGLSYRRYIKKLGYSQQQFPRLKLAAIFARVFNWFFLRDLIQRAVFQFYGRTLKASMFHKMRLATFIAVGIGLIAFQLAIHEALSETFSVISRTTLSIPLIFSFFFLLGIRGIVNMPISLEANWVFQLTESEKRRHYFAGLRKAIFFLNLLPLFVVFFILYFSFWGGVTAFYHCLYGLVVSVLLMEGFFLTYCKIPFACSYLPGKEKLQLLWIIYFFLFLAFINLMAWIESELLKAPSNFPIFFSIAFLIIIGVRIYQLLYFYRKNGIKYEEMPEPVLIDLNYQTPTHQKRIL